MYTLVTLCNISKVCMHEILYSLRETSATCVVRIKSILYYNSRFTCRITRTVLHILYNTSCITYYVFEQHVVVHMLYYGMLHHRWYMPQMKNI